MFRNYLKITLRNFWKNKFTSFVNLLGLTLGIAGCLLIGLFIRDEWRFDRWVPSGERIYRVYDERIAEDGSSFVALTPPVFAATMATDFPEVEQSLRFASSYGTDLFRAGERQYLEEKGLFVDPSFFDFFGLELMAGDAATALAEPNALVLSPALAEKYFGDADPVGQNITVDEREATVTGVFAAPPGHFHLDFNYLLSFSTLEQQVPAERMQSWVWQQFYTYLKLKENADVAALAAKLPAFAERHAWAETESRGFRYIPHLQPLTDIHLHSSDFVWDIARRGSIGTVRTLTAVGLFLLLIAVINFINLSTARSENRAREVGVRKMAGAQRRQLVVQFIGEAVFLAALATLLAVQAVRLLLPALNDFTGKEIALLPADRGGVVLILLGLVLLVGLLAGSYPAFFLSRFRPIHVLKNRPLEGRRESGLLRRGLVVLQFTLTVLLLIGSLVIYRQVRYLDDKDMGFDRERLLTFPLRGDLDERYKTVKEVFRRHPGVRSASVAYGIPGDIIAGDDILVPGREGSLPANLFTVDFDYLETMGLDLVAGRGFSRDYATDADEAFVINETAVRELGFGTPEEALGQRLNWDMWGRDSLKQGRVVGVVRDFHYNSLHTKVGTAVLHIYPDAFWKVILRLRGDDLAGTLAFVKQTWDSFDTGYPIEYQFVDDSFDALYQSEVKLSQLLLLFTFLTIFVACLGLLGLAIFAAERRTKEIGIRKVLGAGTANITALLAGDFVQLVLIAIAIATPLSWYFSRQWLENFSYHVDLSAWVFVLAGAAALLIALLTVSVHSIRAALRNPVEALRYE